LFSIIISLILIGVLVIVHEFGHFIAAKKSGILVEEFSIGMGTKIFSRQKGETEYSIRLLPLGGFCRMQGEGEDGTVGPRSFLNKSIGVRFIVMAAGSFMNFVLALIMIIGLTSTSYMAFCQTHQHKKSACNQVMRFIESMANESIFTMS